MNIQRNNDGICRLNQPGGKTLTWHEGSGVTLLEEDGLYFKDLERSGRLLPYEDWRLSDWERAQDLAQRLSVEEIAGLMIYSVHQMVPPMSGGPFPGTFGGKSFEESGCEAWEMSDEQKKFMESEHIRHVLLSSVKDAATAARWSNELQKKAESMPHGIPVNISSDPRNGASDSVAEFKGGGSDVSKWPEGLGFAACFDPEVVRQFAKDASREYRAMGISTALGPQIDLCTEPRWMRMADTLGMDTNAVKQMVKAYCDGMQTTEDAEGSGWGRESVNVMVKHWPGGGTGEGGRDAHYPFGQFAVYPGANAGEHLKPFTEAAFRLDGATGCAAAVMPYYTVSWGMDCKNGKNVGNSYSEYIIKDLLREKYSFQGVVCTDWGITQDPEPCIDSFGSRCYGMNRMTEAQRCLTILMNGVDQFGGSSEIAPILEAYEIGCREYGKSVMRKRMETSAARLLKNIFQCGLFEDPYLDPEHSKEIVGCEEFCRHGYEAQQKSVVLLKNRILPLTERPCLPLKKGIRVYIPDRKIRESKNFFRKSVPAHTENPVPDSVLAPYAVRVATPGEADVALVFVDSPACDPYSPEDAEHGGNGYLPITLQYRPYTAMKAREHSIAGGDFREDFVDRSYRGKTNTAYNEADLDNILACREAMGEAPVIVCARLNNPMVMSEFEPSADAIVAEFGVSKSAVLDILFGECDPTGRLPVQMPRDMDTVEKHSEDIAFDLVPYTDSQGNVYDYGFGLRYEEK
ncbi:MAG: glycoside hydrolase family 3 C-terminal domain-containing protein [Clostridiales bacterium]|nr:glycoside hydrolase family 3 C-terminal domain-containing protein [Clostridiales bacterium]